MEEKHNAPQYPSMNFWQRLLFGGAFTVLTFILVMVSHLPMCGYLFILALIAIECVALQEYSSLCNTKGISPQTSFLQWLSVLYLGLTYAAIQYAPLEHLPRMLLFITAISLPIRLFKNIDTAIANLATTVFGFVYIIYPLSLLIDINFQVRLSDGCHTSFWLAWLLAVTKGADVFAYIGGKLFGRRQLGGKISPKKTLEGAIIGIVGCAVLSALIPRAWPQDVPLSLSTEKWLLLGLIFGAIGMIGDLTESLLKRDAQVKDSNVIPGLGGVLDIVDSLIFSAPLLYVYLRVMGQLAEQ